MTDVQINTAVQPRTPVDGCEQSVRWMVTFTGFPLGGVRRPGGRRTDRRCRRRRRSAAALTGAVLGAVQSWGCGRGARLPARGSLATAVGLSIGLDVGATAVDFDTDLGVARRPGRGLRAGGRGRPGAWSWPPARPARSRLAARSSPRSWAAGWAITTVDRRSRSTSSSRCSDPAGRSSSPR